MTAPGWYSAALAAAETAPMDRVVLEEPPPELGANDRWRPEILGALLWLVTRVAVLAILVPALVLATATTINAVAIAVLAYATAWCQWAAYQVRPAWMHRPLTTTWTAHREATYQRRLYKPPAFWATRRRWAANRQTAKARRHNNRGRRIQWSRDWALRMFKHETLPWRLLFRLVVLPVFFGVIFVVMMFLLIEVLVPFGSWFAHTFLGVGASNNF